MNRMDLMYFTLESCHKIAKCQKNTKWTSEHGTVRLFTSFGQINIMTSTEAG